MLEEEPPKNLGKEKNLEKLREGTSSHTHTREIKCFKCQGRGHISSQWPSKRTIILRGVKSYSSQDEESYSESVDEIKSKSEDVYPCNRIFL